MPSKWLVVYVSASLALPFAIKISDKLAIFVDSKERVAAIRVIYEQWHITLYGFLNLENQIMFLLIRVVKYA